MMEIFTREGMAASAAVRWGRQYEGFSGKLHDGRWPSDVFLALHKLGDNPHPDDVDKVIGSDGWTTARCDECGAIGDAVVVGEEPDYESNTASICRGCTIRALLLFFPNIQADATDFLMASDAIEGKGHIGIAVFLRAIAETLGAEASDK